MPKADLVNDALQLLFDVEEQGAAEPIERLEGLVDRPSDDLLISQ
jgi:hypothetical protein